MRKSTYIYRLLSQKVNRATLLLSTIIMMLTSISCDYRIDTSSDTWHLDNTYRIDSVAFMRSHHYWKSDIFYVHTPFTTVDRRYIHQPDSIPQDSVLISSAQELAIVDIYIDSNSEHPTVWNKVITFNGANGWIKEEVLMQKIIPDNFVSKFIFHFSEKSTWVYIGIGIVAALLIFVHRKKHRPLRFPHYNDVETFYPTLLCLLISIEATIYGTIQCFAPDTWVEFYFHPTLNPFSDELPIVLIAFICGIWLLIISFIAVVEDLTHQFNHITDYLAYLSTLVLLCAILYIIFSLSVHIYIGYVLLLAYVIFAFYRHFHHATPQYTCGKCGAFIAKNGVCHECGAVNELK